MLKYDVEAFMQYCSRKGLSAKTMASYEQTLRLFEHYLSEEPETKILLTEKITHTHIAAYVTFIQERGKYTVCTVKAPASPNYPDRRTDYGKKVSATTINNYLRNMNAFFHWCMEEDIIRRNPIKRTDFIKAERKPLQFVSDEDFKRLLKAMDASSFSEYRDSVIIQLLLDSGMRVGECLASKLDKLDLTKRCLLLPAEITKGKKDRYVFFSDKTARTLKRWLQYKDRYRDSDYIFCTNLGKALQVTNFETNIRKYAHRIGLKDIHPHCFRNNFAKRFLMSGGDIYTLSRILGHSSVAVTEQAYLDLNEDDLMTQYKKHSPIENMK